MTSEPSSTDPADPGPTPPGQAAEASPARPPRTDWLLMAVVVASGVVAAIHVGKAATALTAIRTDLGIGLGAASWILGVFAVLGVAGGIPAGAAVTRYGDRRLLLIGMLSLVVGGVAGAQTSRLSTLLATRVIEGGGFLLVVVAAPAVLERTTASRDRDLAFSIWSSFMPAGMAIALLAGPALPGWRQVWLGTAALAAGAAALQLATARRGLPAAVPSRPVDWRSTAWDAAATIQSGGPLLAALAFATYTLQFFAVTSFLPVLLGQRMNA
jgi:MFS family permease